MIKFFQKFARDESGAVTVDWVVLTAAVVGLGIAVMAAVNTGVKGVAGGIATDMAGQLNGADTPQAAGAATYAAGAASE